MKILLKKLYLSTALLLTNTLFFFIIINLIMGVFFIVHDFFDAKKTSLSAKQVSLGRFFNPDGSPIDNGKRFSYQLQWFDFNAYKSNDQKYAAEILDDFYQLFKLGFSYQPWVQLAEPLYQGKRVNVISDELGFPVRRTVNPHHDPNFSPIKVFIFGGSNIFGYNVADEQTLPSYLSQILNAKISEKHLPYYLEVNNYGHGYYDTSQELVLLIDLLKIGYRPSLVIFLDGVNYTGDEDIPSLTSEFTNRWKTVQFSDKNFILQKLNLLPLARFIELIRSKVNQKYLNWDMTSTAYANNEKMPIQWQINRFIQNDKLIDEVCKLYSIPCQKYLQPDAIYNYPFNLYRNSIPESFIAMRKDREKFYQQIRLTSKRTDLTDLFQKWGPGQKAILDDVHYSPDFNKYIAEQIASTIDLNSLTAKLFSIDYSSATGTRR